MLLTLACCLLGTTQECIACHGVGPVGSAHWQVSRLSLYDRFRLLICQLLCILQELHEILVRNAAMLYLLPIVPSSSWFSMLLTGSRLHPGAKPEA